MINDCCFTAPFDVNQLVVFFMLESTPARKSSTIVATAPTVSSTSSTSFTSLPSGGIPTAETSPFAALSTEIGRSMYLFDMRFRHN